MKPIYLESGSLPYGIEFVVKSKEMFVIEKLMTR